LLPSGKITGTANQGIEAMVELPAQVADRHVPDPRSGQLDCQRQAVETAADLSCDLDG
jgi:hypothetical protein